MNQDDYENENIIDNRNLSIEEYQKTLDFLIDYLEKCNNCLKFPKLKFNISNRDIIENDNMNRNSICFIMKDPIMKIKFLYYRSCLMKIQQISRTYGSIRDKIISNIIKFENEINQIFKNKKIESYQLIDLFDKYELKKEDIEFHIENYKISIKFLNKYSKELIISQNINDYIKFFSESNFSFKYDKIIN